MSFFGQDRGFARELSRAGTFAAVVGAAVSLLAALTGFWDWLRSTEAGTRPDARRMPAPGPMLRVTALVLVDIGLRTLAFPDDGHTPAVVAVLSVVIAAVTALGAAIGAT